MSLKAFHIAFVSIATLFAFWFGLWALRDYRGGGETGSLVVAVSCWVGCVVLVWYGRWFLRKLKGVSYL